MPARRSQSGFIQNFNRGRSSNAGSAFATTPQLAGLGYLTSQDTGVSVGGGSPGDWRAIWSGDTQQIAVVPDDGGVRIWYLRYEGQWWIQTVVDTGGYLYPDQPVLLGTGGSQLYSPASSNLVGLPHSNACVTGAAIADGRNRIATNPIDAGAGRSAVVSEITDIAPGAALTFAADAAGPAETVVVQDVIPIVGGGGTIVADFSHNHGADVRVTLERWFIAEIHGAVATRISQYLPAAVSRIAVDPHDTMVMCAIAGGQLWRRSPRSSAGVPLWAPATTDLPPALQQGGDRYLTGIAYDSTGRLCALLNASTIATRADPTPLFWIKGDTWIAEQSDDPARGAAGYRNLAAHPTVSQTLYATFGDSVFEITLSQGRYQWRDLSQDSSPLAPATDGTGVYDLSVTNIGTNDMPTVLLQVLFAYRNVWECDVTTPGAAVPSPPQPFVYARDHILDHPLSSPRDAIINPFRPSRRLWHFQSPDIKVDARQTTASGLAFYQTDPERTITPTRPLDYISFSQLNDFSQNLPSNDLANIHVQVHNRSSVPASGVSVWVLWCNAAAVLPALNATVDGRTYDGFWEQFAVTGEIIPSLPLNSAWKPVGPVQTVDRLDAASPQVVTISNWPVPMLGPADPGHYCLVAFIHGAGPLRLRPVGYVVDELVPANKQIAQKNLHVIAPFIVSLPSESAQVSDFGEGSIRREYIEFNNPYDSVRTFDILFDLRELPDAIRTTVRLSAMHTELPMKSVFAGVVARKASRLRALGSFLPAGLARNIGAVSLQRFIRNLRPWVTAHIVFDSGGHPRIRRLHLASTVYELASGKNSTLSRLILPAYGRAAAEITFELINATQADGEFEVAILQLQKGQALGGSTYVLRIGSGRTAKARDPFEDWYEPEGWPEHGLEDKLSGRVDLG
jgi:hypothetical protein